MVPAMSDDPVVVTGIGMVTPLGPDTATTWHHVLRGVSAGEFLPYPPDLDAVVGSRKPTWIGAPARPGGTSADDPVINLACLAVEEALRDAGEPQRHHDRERIGCVFGTSKGSLYAATACQTGGSHEAWERMLAGPALASMAVAARYELYGPRISPVAACATGIAAVLQGAALVCRDDCEVAVVGSADDSLHPLVLASFQRLGVLASATSPSQASRPFDRRRNGFVIGAGAGALILERRSRAQSRGVRWYAELGPGRMLGDPTGVTALDASGETLAALIHRCVPAGAVPDVINLHGTGTRLNDPAECRALRQVFGSRLTGVSCGSLKGGLGHLLGAAGSVELALGCKMLAEQTVPPNANLDDVDPACDLPWVRGMPERRAIASLLKLSLGFGGHQGALWLNHGNR